MKTKLIAVMLTIAILSACADSTKKQAPEQTGAETADSSYGDLSEKEHCVRNFARSTNERDIDRYAELFREDCEFIYMQDKLDLDSIDFFSGPILGRSNLQDELKIMESLFSGAQDIRLELEGGDWIPYRRASNDSCDNCWETTRAYALAVTMGGGGESRVMEGRGHFRFIVSPAEGKWKIFRHIEEPLKKQGGK